jgi:hypothetical protein
MRSQEVIVIRGNMKRNVSSNLISFDFYITLKSHANCLFIREFCVMKLNTFCLVQSVLSEQREVSC